MYDVCSAVYMSCFLTAHCASLPLLHTVVLPPPPSLHVVSQVTVIPVIAKADTMTDAELEAYREEVRGGRGGAVVGEDGTKCRWCVAHKRQLLFSQPSSWRCHALPCVTCSLPSLVLEA